MQWRFFHIGRICVPFAQKVAEIGLWTQVAKWSQGPLCVMGYVMTSGNEQNRKYNRLKFKNGGGSNFVIWPQQGVKFHFWHHHHNQREKCVRMMGDYVCKPECVIWPPGGLILHNSFFPNSSCDTNRVKLTFPTKFDLCFVQNPPKNEYF